MHFDLDELVGLQAHVDFVQDFLGKAVVAYHDHGVEAVAQRAQMADVLAA